MMTRILARDSLRSDSAHTLIEALISIAILGVLFVGILVVFMGGTEFSEVANNERLALAACREVMEALLSLDISRLPAQNGLTFDFIAIPLENPTIGRIGVRDISGGKGDCYEITVSIDHPGGSSTLPFSTRLVTRKAR